MEILEAVHFIPSSSPNATAHLHCWDASGKWVELRNRRWVSLSPSAFGLLILPSLATPTSASVWYTESENEVGDEETEAQMQPDKAGASSPITFSLQWQPAPAVWPHTSHLPQLPLCPSLAQHTKVLVPWLTPSRPQFTKSSSTTTSNSSSRLYASRLCLKFHLSKVNLPGQGFLPTSFKSTIP